MATNEILPFASTNTGTNLLTQAEYEADAQRTTGNQPGIARSKLVNKSLRQASLLAAGLGKFMADRQANNITDSLTEAQIATYLQDAISSLFQKPVGIQGSFKNLSIQATGSSASVQVSIDEITVKNASGSVAVVQLYDGRTLNTTTVGANGLDTGLLAANTWYSLWVIYSETSGTIALLCSLSQSSPTMPSGYTHKARIGWFRTDSTVSKYPLAYIQRGRRAQYTVKASGSNVDRYPYLAYGIYGAPANNPPTMASVSYSTVVPPTAMSIRIIANHGQSSGDNSRLIAGPSNQFTEVGASPRTAPLNNTTAVPTGQSMQADIILEQSVIYYASDKSNAYIACVGWEDNI